MTNELYLLPAKWWDIAEKLDHGVRKRALMDCAIELRVALEESEKSGLKAVRKLFQQKHPIESLFFEQWFGETFREKFLTEGQCKPTAATLDDSSMQDLRSRGLNRTADALDMNKQNREENR